MLSETFKSFCDIDAIRLQNLLRGICRIMVSLANKVQSQIGSLRFNDDCSTTLTNRPLFCANSILESEGAPRTVNRTYTTSGGFMDDMLQFRENAFSAQPNAVNDEEDCRLQMLHMILLRRLKSHFVDQHFEGPFVLQFTDFHASNIFVDDQWNIVALVDLEFVCALPADMMEVPYWLTVNTIDEMTEHTDTATRMHELFVSILRDEERLLDRQKQPSRATSIHHAWMTDLCWFYCCFTSIDGIARCLEDHLYKKFNFEPSLAEERHYAKIISSRWSSESSAFVEQKLHDKARYDDDLARHFRGQAERRDELPLQRDLSCI
jgi:hypothetical protein